jgi:hypothetical protein
MTLAIIDLYVRKHLPRCGTHVHAFRETHTQGTKLPVCTKSQALVTTTQDAENGKTP